MSEAEDKAAKLVHPLAVADATGMTGVFRMALTGALQSFPITEQMRGKFATLTVCSTDDVQFAFGSGAVAPALALNAISAPGGVGNAAAGKTIFSKTSLDRMIPKGATFLAVISTGGAGGYLELDVSEYLN